MDLSWICKGFVKRGPRVFARGRMIFSEDLALFCHTFIPSRTILLESPGKRAHPRKQL